MAQPHFAIEDRLDGPVAVVAGALGVIHDATDG